MALPKISPKAKRLIRNFDNAAQEFAFMGAQPKEEWDDIRRNYKEQKTKLYEYISELETDGEILF